MTQKTWSKNIPKTWHIHLWLAHSVKPKARRWAAVTSLRFLLWLTAFPHCLPCLCSFTPSFICVLEVIGPSLIVLVFSIIISSIIFTWLPLLRLPYSPLCPLPNTGTQYMAPWGYFLQLDVAGAWWQAQAVSGPPPPLSIDTWWRHNLDSHVQQS